VANKAVLSVLKQRIDFLKLMKNGQRIRPSDWLLVNFAPNHDGIMRCGWTLPRQVGPAVVRNRLKRWSRVYFRNLIETDETLPVDINLVFRKAADDFYKKLDYEKFAAVMDRSWKQISRRIGRNA
jgi:ribonuclease P protein component